MSTGRRRSLAVGLGMAARSILIGWATLVPTTYLLHRYVVPLMARWMGADWTSTTKLALDCLALAAAGWLTGRSYPARPIVGVLAFAATLMVIDLDAVAGINVPWLLHLTADALHDSRYWDSLASTAGQQLLLFSSLIGGALLSRPSPTPVSITE